MKRGKRLLTDRQIKFIESDGKAFTGAHKRVIKREIRALIKGENYKPILDQSLLEIRLFGKLLNAPSVCGLDEQDFNAECLAVYAQKLEQFISNSRAEVLDRTLILANIACLSINKESNQTKVQLSGSPTKTSINNSPEEVKKTISHIEQQGRELKRLIKDVRYVKGLNSRFKQRGLPIPLPIMLLLILSRRGGAFMLKDLVNRLSNKEKTSSEEQGAQSTKSEEEFLHSPLTKPVRNLLKKFEKRGLISELEIKSLYKITPEGLKVVEKLVPKYLQVK